MRKILHSICYCVCFFVLVFSTAHIISYINTKDLTKEEPFKWQFYIVTFNKQDNQVNFINIYENKIDLENYYLNPLKNEGRLIRDNDIYTYEILSQKDSSVEISTKMKSDDYTIISKYLLFNNEITKVSSYLFSFDYILVSMLISLILLFIIKFIYKKFC